MPTEPPQSGGRSAPQGGLLRSLCRKGVLLLNDPARATASYTRDREPRGGLLVYYARAPTTGFWARYWEGRTRAERSRREEARQRDPTIDLLAAVMPRCGKVLEGGCGMGRMVAAMRDLGIDCEGVELSADVVAAARAKEPDLPIRQGDVLALDVPDGHYSGYISLGVIEHRREGPEPFLTEAHRVVAPGGVLAVSVPCYNPVRRLKAAFGLVRRRHRELPFFQYAMTPEVLRAYVRRAGFQPVGTRSLDTRRGFSEEARAVHLLFHKVPVLGPALRSWLDRSRWARRAFGHMVMVVAMKSGR